MAVEVQVKQSAKLRELYNFTVMRPLKSETLEIYDIQTLDCLSSYIVIWTKYRPALAPVSHDVEIIALFWPVIVMRVS